MTHSGGKPHAVGDRGQRYEITVYDQELQKRRTFGWSTTYASADAMGKAACLRPSWSNYEIEDRQPGKPAFPCKKCGYEMETDDKHGCPNCHGEGLE